MRSSFDARLRASLSRRIALRSSFDARIALRRRLTVHGLANSCSRFGGTSSDIFRHRARMTTVIVFRRITRRMTKTRRLSADSFGGRSRPPFDDPRPTFTAPILFRRLSPLITVSHLPLKSRCRITACDPLSRTAAAPLRDISDHLSMILYVTHRDPRRLLHHLSTMRRRAASTSRSVLVFRRSRSCSPDRAFM